MGKAIIVLRISPVEGGNLEEILEAIKQVKGCNSAKIEDFVFGAKIIKASVVYEDGDNRDIQSEIFVIKGVSNVEVVEEGLL